MLFLLLTLLGLFALVLIYYNVLLPREIQPKRLDSWHFIYREGNSAPRDMKDKYMELLATLSKEFDDLSSITCAGIYFDSPAKLKHENEMRWAIGIKADENNFESMKMKMGKHGFKHKLLPSVYCVANEVPYRNKLNFLLTKLYIGKLIDFLHKANIKREKDTLVEIMELNGKQPYIGFYCPFNKNADDYYITSLKEPETLQE